MVYDHQETDDLIYQAVHYDDWGRVSKTFEEHPELRTKPVNGWVETPLMIAVGTNQSHAFVKNLLLSLSRDRDLIMGAIAAKNDEGDTALHYATKNENMTDAKRLVAYWSKPVVEILLDKNNNGVTPLFNATSFGRNTKMLKYFYSLGIFLSPTIGSGVSNGIGSLLKSAINAEFPDIALKLVENGSVWDLHQSLHSLVYKSNLFPSGRKLGFWHRCIYDLLPVYASKVSSDEKMTSQQIAHDQEAIYVQKKTCNTAYYKCISTTTIFMKRILQYLASPFKNIYDLKRRHKQTKQLVKRICKILKQKGDQDTVCAILVSTIYTAVEFGNYEVIKECILVYPSVIWTQLEEYKVFHQAITQRQEQVYNLIYQMSTDRALVLSGVDDKTGDNVLHIAAKLAPSHRLNTTTGAALQMQRELQWFMEIESIVEPSVKLVANKDAKTPEMVFRDEHKELLQQGKEWMKDTASSSTVVAALIVTVAFAAVFTLPGGDANKGKIAFTFFIIADAIALFSSATSALLFLGILTSRYAQRDFLHVLPRILMSGLFSLFLSLAATMITFSATLALVLQREMPWIAAPLVVITSIPIGMFVLIQRPLLVELFYSTYGPNIFRK